MTKSECIKYLVSRGQAAELYKLMTRTSVSSIEDVSNPKKPTLSIEMLKLLNGGHNYFEFVSKFGTEKKHVIENGRHYFARFENFNLWLSSGAPGIEEEELKNLLSSLEKKI